MSGVRVQSIDPQTPEKLVLQYVSDLCSRAAIKEVYYPVLNNDAIVIFKDQSATTKMLTSKHEKWTVLPLPNQVFSKHRVWLEQDLTCLLQDHEGYQEVLKNNAQVDISAEKNSKQLMLTGQSYQIEWAWRYLSNLQDQLQHSSGFRISAAMSTSASPQPNGDALTNGDINHSPMSRNHHPGHGSHASLRHPDDSQLQNRNVASHSDVTSLAIGSVADRRRLPSPRTGSSDSSPRNQNRGKEGRRVRPALPDVTSLAIEGLYDERQNSPPAVADEAASAASVLQKGRTSQASTGASQASTGAISKSRTSPPRSGDDSEVVEDSEQRDYVKNMPQLNRHANAGDRVGAYTSLPVNKPGAVRIPREQPTSPSQSTGKNSKPLSLRGATCTDLDKAEVIYRASSRHQSLSYSPSASRRDEDDDYGAVGGPQSLVSWNGEEGRGPNYEDVDMRGAYGGQRPFTSLPYNNSSSSLRPPANNKLALLNRSVADLSRKHFDVSHRLKLKIYVDDITQTRTQAVVNAANWELKNIGGVAGALAKAAGPEMERECLTIYRTQGALKTAEVVKTKAYGRLSHLKWVLHTVGPIYRKEDPDKCVFELAQTFLNCLVLAENLYLDSITFPFISTGIFGMPVELCVLSLFTALMRYGFERHSNLSTLEEVHFINNDMDIVCNAVLSAEITSKKETIESCVNRMKDGQKLYGRSIFPFCNQSATPTPKKTSSDDRYATWDSSPDQGATAAKPDRRGRQVSREREDQEQLDAETDSQPATSKSPSGSHRTRSRSFDRGSKTMTAAANDSQTSRNASGRDSSPMPRPRSRSNSLSGSSRASGGASSQGGSSASASASASAVLPRSQPLIKQSLVPAAVSGKKRSVGLAKSVGRGRTSDQSSNDTDLSSAAASETEDTDKTCPICLEDIKQPKNLPCGHTFCTSCVDKAMSVYSRCPKCQRVFGIATGTQPRGGTMTYSTDYRGRLSGYPGAGVITITYDFPPGRQEACHPNPGRHYEGTHRVAYLPDTPEGRDVLKMLQKAFDQRLVFTIGDSVTTGAKGVITWNDIHHKTSTYGGPTQFGYPDPEYLFRVREELAAKGITHP